MSIKEIELEVANWVRPVQKSDEWSAIANTVKKYTVLTNVGKHS